MFSLFPYILIYGVNSITVRTLVRELNCHTVYRKLKWYDIYSFHLKTCMVLVESITIEFFDEFTIFILILVLFPA
jgi:hypothetical protein